MILNFNKKIIFFFLIVFILLSIFMFVLQASSENNHITLKEAYFLGLSYARDWDVNATLVLMASVDNIDADKDGIDGRRRYWNFEFAVPNTNNHYIVTIHDRQVVRTTKTRGPNSKEELIYPDEINIDSNRIVKMAQKDFQIIPGKGWAGGFHFTLNKIRKVLILTVTGRDKNGFLSKINYNAITGELISAIHKVTREGGIFKGLNRIPSINEHTAILGASISPNFSTDKTMVFWGYSDYMTDNMQPITKITFNGGDSWLDLNTSEEISQVFFSEFYSNNKKIYLLSNTDVFESDDMGLNNECIFHSSDEILASDYRDNTILILTPNKINIFDTKVRKSTYIDVPQGTKNLTFVGNDIFILSNDKVYKFGNGWIELPTPIYEKIAIDSIDDNLVCYSKDSVAVYGLEINKWQVYSSAKEINRVYFDGHQNDNISFYISCTEGELFKIEK